MSGVIFMNNNDCRQLIDGLKDQLLHNIFNAQYEYRSAGHRHSRMSSDQKSKFLDALARVFCFTTNSVCSSVYIDDTKKEILLSSNNTKLTKDNIQTAWNDIIDNKVESTAYVEKYLDSLSNNHSQKSVNGYISAKNWDTLFMQLKRFEHKIAFMQLQNKDTPLEKLQVAFIQLKTAIQGFIYQNSSKESYTETIKQAYECASIFKEWKREYQAADTTQGPSSPKAYKNMFQYLVKDKELDCVVDEIKELRSLIYSLRKFDSDLQKVKDTIEREQFKSYTVILPHHDKTLHAEIKIIDYLQNNHDFNEHTTHKIGISKLACTMCYEIIKAYEKQNNTKIHIKGYHGKVYARWSYPEEGNLEIYKAALTNIAKQYQIGFLLQYKMLKDEASTNTSMSTYSDDSEQRDDEHNSKLNSYHTQDMLQNSTEILDLVDKTVIEKHVRILKELLTLHINDQFGHNKTDIEVFDNNRFYWIDNQQFFPSDIEQYAQDKELTYLLGEYNKRVSTSLEEESWD